MRVLAFSVMKRRERKVYYLVLASWLVASVVFWTWWFRPRHIGNLFLYGLMSWALFYESTLLPFFYMFFLGKMKVPFPMEPEGSEKVAMITLCVPSKESMGVIERQLRAMTEVEYPHDSWILDEGKDPRVRNLADKYGVYYFSREGLPRYNQDSPPFQKKTKAGNVNAWIAEHGKEYEYFVQLDIDHIPKPNYLNRVLGYFRDPKVAWVQAPSVYDNFEHWAARGSAEQELVLQGPLQMGFFGYSETPFIIGSHSTYRMSAVKEIGGFQPTRAEDHLDTVVLAGKGYRGVFVPEIIAVGDGPESFDTYLSQQFAWAYSMIQVLFYHTPKHFFSYNRRQRLQFLFAQAWYALWSTSMGLLFVLPLVALLTQPITNMAFIPFILRYIPIPVLSLAIWFWSLQKGWFRPQGISLSWRGVVLHIARWPAVLWALLNVILGIKKSYMITKKGLEHGEKRPFQIGNQLPYLLLIGVSLFSVWLFLLQKQRGSTQGYLLFVLEGALMMLAVYASALAANIAETYREGVTMFRVLRLRLGALLLFLILVSVLVVTAWASAPAVVEAIAWVPSEKNVPRYVEMPPELRKEAIRVSRAEEVVGPGDVNTGCVSKEDVYKYQSEYKYWSGSFADVFTATPKAFPTVTPTPTKVPFELPVGVAIGAYDPSGEFETITLAVEHAFVPWFLTKEFRDALEEIRSRKRFPLVSLEPWPYKEDGLVAETLLRDINQGSYDQWIVGLAEIVRQQKPQVVMLRWGHEMELTGLYPWSTEDAEAYVSAYRRVVSIFEEQAADNVLWVWSPAGNSGAESYYPGAEYVDYVGVTILADSRWDAIAGFDRMRSFDILLMEKYRLVEEFQKPLIIAELGISSKADVQKIWLENAFEDVSKYPALRGIVYFNALNTHATGDGYKPDWQISAEVLEAVMNLR